MTLDGVAAGGDGQTGEQRREASEVRGAVATIAEGDVFDQFGLDAGPLDSAADRMRGHRHGGCDVEATTAGLGETGTGIGDEDCFTHERFPDLLTSGWLETANPVSPEFAASRR